MRFHLDVEQTSIRDSLQGVLGELWNVEQIHSFVESGRDFHGNSWAAMIEFGLPGLLVNPDSGGSGLGLIEAALCIEVVGRAAATGPILGQMLGALAVASLGAEHNGLLTDILAGKAIVTIGHGNVPVQAGCVATHVLIFHPDGRSSLRSMAAAEEAIAICSTDRTRPLSRIVWKQGAAEDDLWFDEPGLARKLSIAGCILVAADALGGARYCSDAALAYCKERHQFGQPVGQFQALKHQLVQMAIDVESSTGLLWLAAYHWDHPSQETDRIAAIAKAHICDVFTKTARASIAAHGGIGYTWELGLHYWLRRSVYGRSWLGDPSFHRSRVTLGAELTALSD